MIGRRTVLGGLGALALAACTRTPSTERNEAVETLRYGDDPSQLLEITRPDGPSRGVVVVIHGGFWKSAYDLDLGRPLADSLAREGWTAVNVEYRRVGNGGGWPQTFDDVEAAIESLARTDLDTTKLITLGHSAGGHLATWVAGRPTSIPVTGVVSQAGVLDLVGARREGLGGGAVDALMGADLDAHLSEADPMSAIPLDVPVRCVHGDADQVVPIAQSTRYVDAATAAGADATVTPVAGDHFVVIDPTSAAWRTTLELLDAL